MIFNGFVIIIFEWYKLSILLLLEEFNKYIDVFCQKQ
jgi:hypothetical protein